VLYKKYKRDSNARIYIIINKLNGKCYVGSTKSLRHRVLAYFNLALLITQKRRPISSAILKYGLVNFAFVIIEEVDTNLYNIEERETY
jgi:group I intron endonuclease